MRPSSQHNSQWRRLSSLQWIAFFVLGFFTLLQQTMAAPTGQSSAEFYIHDLPGAPDGPLLQMHAGDIEVTPENHGNLFFWHYAARHRADRTRTVIWLNGGPGCSSLDGALMEIGPYRVGAGGNLTYNDGSWDEFANLLFVDNPVGTGFGFADTNSYIHELDTMADQFIIFLEKWFAIFPQYEHDDIYIAGESYAGQHIPYIAKAIQARNSSPRTKISWNMKGLLIGNGWTAPVEQYAAYLPFAYKENVLQSDTPAAKRAEELQTKCFDALSAGGKDHVNTDVCENILGQILASTRKGSGKDGTCTNMYDVRLTSDSSCGMDWPPDLTNVTPWLQREDVKRALHVSPQKQTGWTECNSQVGAAFRAQNSTPAVNLLPELLESALPILLFSGDKDLICNHIGTEKMIDNLSWSSGTGFELAPSTFAPKRSWVFEGQPAGQWQAARNLTYVRFYNASHMVPFDWPRRTRDMLDRFMGVDIASIGGAPADSRIDGEKGKETSVGGHTNSTTAKEGEKDRVKDAEWKAYQKSGEAVLIVVIIAAGAWGWWVWTQRRKRARLGYSGVAGGGDDDEGGLSAEGAAGVFGSFRDTLVRTPKWKGGPVNGNGNGNGRRRTLEAADFDENELDDLVAPGSGRAERFDLGDDDSDEDEGIKGGANGNGHAR